MTKLSPKAKILIYVVLALAVFIFSSLKILFLLLWFVLYFAAKIPVSTLKRGLIPIFFFLVFTFISNLLFQSGEIYHSILGIAVTGEGMYRGALLTLRLLILILGAKILTATAEPQELVDGMKDLIGPLNRIDFVNELMITMTLTVRLLPIVYDEALTIFRAMKNSRGIGFSGRIRLAVEMLIQLFEKSLRRAKELPDMEK